MRQFGGQFAHKTLHLPTKTAFSSVFSCGQSRSIISKVDFESNLQESYELAIKIAKISLPFEQHNYKNPSSITSPTKDQIVEFRSDLENSYKSNQGFKKVCDIFFREIGRQNCNGVIINAKIYKEETPAINGFASLLLWSAFLSKFGFNPNYRESGEISFAHTEPNNISELPGHQDVMPILKKSHLKPSGFELAANLVLIGAYSDSTMKTWLIESENIFEDLKKKDFFEILTLQKFTEIDPIAHVQKERVKKGRVLIKKDEGGKFYFDGFDVRKSYIPENLNSLSAEKSKNAVRYLKEVLARDEHRLTFRFHHQDAQMAVFNNKNCFHGRTAEDIGNSQPNATKQNSPRWLLVLADFQNFLGISPKKPSAQKLSEASKSKRSSGILP